MDKIEAYKWWRSLSINEMKYYEEKYRESLCIYRWATNRDIVIIYEKENCK